MEFTIQKSIELGVNVITPLFSERCGVKLDAERRRKDSAVAENCHRRLRAVRSQSRAGNPRRDDARSWCAEADDGLKLNLHPRASHSINTLPQPVERVRLLIGPEGGLSAEEIAMTAARLYRYPARSARFAHRNHGAHRHHGTSGEVW